MGFFSQKITADKLTESLAGLFDASYNGLSEKVRGLLVGTEILNENQNQELLAVSLAAVVYSVFKSLEETPAKRYVIGKLQSDVFNQHFLSPEKRSVFATAFSTRVREYTEVLNSENRDAAIQIGEIFYTHFGGKKDGVDNLKLKITVFVGSAFLHFAIETKKYLDEVVSKYEIVL